MRASPLILLLFTLTLFTSCNATLNFTPQKDGAAFILTLDCAKDNPTGRRLLSYIEVKRIKEDLTSIGVKSIKIKLNAMDKLPQDEENAYILLDTLEISGKISSKNSNPFTLSKVLTFTKNTLNLNFTTKTAKNLYQALPTFSASFIDMYMCPFLNDEEMEDSEYLENLLLVYGEEVVDRVKDGNLTFIISDKVNRTITYPFIRLLNLTSPLVLE